METHEEHPLRRLYRYAHKDRKKAFAAIFFSITNKIFDLAPPMLIGVAVDIVVKQEDSLFAEMGIQDPFYQLVVLAIVTVLVWSLESLFQYLYEIYWRNLAQVIQHDLRIETYSHIQNMDMKFFHEESTGGLMSIMNDDVNQLERFLDSGANDLIQVATTAIVICSIFFYFAPSVAILSMLPIPIILWGSFKYQKLLQPRYRRVREEVSLLNGQLNNNLSGITTIKSYATEGYETDRIRVRSDVYREANSKAIRISSAFSPLIRMAVVTGFIATLVWGGKLTIAGTLAVGTYSVLVFLTQRLLWPLTRLGTTFDQYQRAMASTRRILNLLDTKIEIVDGDVHLPKASIKGEITFENVHFAYPGRDPILQDFSLTIAAGETIGIVGATGSGKSTLINLLLRFYEPQSGKISIDGKPIKDITLNDLRSGIGLVSQQVFLFHGTVRENITYGTFDATDDQLIAAANASESTEFIQRLPSQFDTIVGERGETLSGGQKQRISIARAVLKDPPILILDEATSAVDNETEAAIQRSVEQISQSRTTIAIAHRLSTIRHADRIIVLDQGKISEQGTHDSLLEKGGLYASLWSVQTGEQTTQSTSPTS